MGTFIIIKLKVRWPCASVKHSRLCTEHLSSKPTNMLIKLTSLFPLKIRVLKKSCIRGISSGKDEMKKSQEFFRRRRSEVWLEVTKCLAICPMNFLEREEIFNGKLLY